MYMYLTIDNEAKKVESSPKKIGRNCPPPNALWVLPWHNFTGVFEPFPNIHLIFRSGETATLERR